MRNPPTSLMAYAYLGSRFRLRREICIGIAALNNSRSMAVNLPPLERSAALWLMATMGIVLLPHATHQPAWVSAFVAVVWSLRTWIAWRSLQRPSAIVIVSLAAAGIL